MKKIVTAIISVVLVCIIATLSLLTVFIFKPMSEMNKNHDSLSLKAYEKKPTGSRIHFLNTENSDCILLESDGHFALVDCGEDTDNPRGFEGLELKGFEDKVLRYLFENAADEDGNVYLDFVLGTHAHSDHIGGFDTIISNEKVSVGRAYLKEYDETRIETHEVTDWDNKEVYSQMLAALLAKNIPVISEIDETQFTLGSFNITLFNTEYDEGTELIGENDNAIGVLVEKDGVKTFLAADIDNKSGDEEKLAPQIGEIDILKVGHHSYSESTTSKWLKTLSPKLCIVTNLYEKADKRTLRRITRLCHSPILLTGKENGIVIEYDNGYEIMTGSCK